MKKINLLKLYETLPGNKILITEELPSLLSVRGPAEEVLLKLVEDNDEFLDEDILEQYISLSLQLGSIKNSYYRNIITRDIKKLLDSDLVRENYLYNDVIDQLFTYLNMNLWNNFDVYDYEELIFYTSCIINEFTKAMLNIEELDNINKMDILFDGSMYILDDINNTESANIDYKENDVKLRRIHEYFDIAGDKELFKLPEDKYKSVIEVAACTSKVEELKRLKNIAKLNRMRKKKDFDKLLDSSSSDLTVLSIDKIYDKIKYIKEEATPEDGSKTTFYSRPKRPEKLDKALQKVLKNNNNT